MPTQLEIEMHPVESSNIDSIGHDPETKTLRVKFRSGGTYDYSEFPAEKFAEFRRAKSHGGHFHKHIRGKHAFTKLS